VSQSEYHGLAVIVYVHYGSTERRRCVIATLQRSQEVLGWNLGPEAGYHAWGFS